MCNSSSHAGCKPLPFLLRHFRECLGKQGCCVLVSGRLQIGLLLLLLRLRLLLLRLLLLLLLLLVRLARRGRRYPRPARLRLWLLRRLWVYLRGLWLRHGCALWVLLCHGMRWLGLGLRLARHSSGRCAERWSREVGRGQAA